MNAKQQIAEFLGEYSNDPVGFVYAAFPWGEDGLEDMEGPQEWQIQVLKDVKNGLTTIDKVIRNAVASGNGIGKSALVSWLVLWSLSTFEDTRGVVTANTEAQLRTKTWAELAKWYHLFIGKDLFTFTATAIFSSQKGHDKTWRIDALPWSESNPEAFAGLHNKGKRLVLIMDEASAIPTEIWEVAEGAMTDKNTQIMWMAFGNPTRNTGRFFDCFHRLRNFWTGRQIDSRTVEISNKSQLQDWIDQWGLDSDFVKVHVLGQFPNTSECQFISVKLAEGGRGKEISQKEYGFAPKIIGVDPAWTGGDSTAIVMRQGLKATVLANVPRNDNDFTIAQMIANFEDKYKADGVCIDLGYGTGIYSAGKTMGRNWMLVSFAEKSPSKGYHNMRAYMWGAMRQWLIDGGGYDNDQGLFDDLISPETKPRVDGVIQLEGKQDMKRRGLPSPNKADALALTFARPIVRASERTAMCNTEYNFFPKRGGYHAEKARKRYFCKTR